MTETIDRGRNATTRRRRRQHTEHGLERKQQLLDAAATLFAERGYAATRIADICTASGVAKGLFYWYFPTKQELFAELVRTMRLRLRRAQAAAMDPRRSRSTRSARAAEASVRFMAEHAAYFALLDVERADRDMAPCWRGAERLPRRRAPSDRRGPARGDVRPDDAELLAVGVLGAVSAFSNSYRNGRLDVSVDELATFVRGWVANALA